MGCKTSFDSGVKVDCSFENNFICFQSENNDNPWLDFRFSLLKFQIWFQKLVSFLSDLTANENPCLAFQSLILLMHLWHFLYVFLGWCFSNWSVRILDDRGLFIQLWQWIFLILSFSCFFVMDSKSHRSLWSFGYINNCKRYIDVIGQYGIFGILIYLSFLYTLFNRSISLLLLAKIW